MKLTEQGHTTICDTISANKTFWLAWGTHTSSLENTIEDLNSEILIDELGRTKETFNGFVIPDEAGPIEVSGQNWSISVTPSKYLYLRFTFGQNTNPTSIIRQLALFTDVQLSAGNELLTYIDTSVIKDDKMDDIGKIFETMNQADLIRDEVTAESYNMIITF